ncbi:MAG: two-component system, cell cycle sensor histidine kinase and response regulator CckA [Bacteroidota bacterium]|nr:two-component system, cell cycle sensor histidine kinase and response regulator CckA [Bacteroidota bacterium]
MMIDSVIMIVEDEGIVAEDLRLTLENLGYLVPCSVPSGEEALVEAEKHKPDLVLMDIMLKGKMNGLETAEIIKNKFDIPVIYLTAYADEQTLLRAKLTEPFGYILKPFNVKELHSTIEIALYKAEIEQKLKDSEEKYRTLFENMLDGIYHCLPDGTIIDINPALVRILGYEDKSELLGANLNEMIMTDVEFDIKNELLTLPEGIFRIRMIRSDGSAVWVENKGQNIYDDEANLLFLEGMIRDIDDRITAETAIRNVQKMESLGVLAGGIAHDFNNLLQAMLSNIGLAVKKLEPSHPAMENITKAETALSMASELTQQLLSYSGKGKYEQKVLYVNDIINHNIHLFEISIPKNITLEIRLTEEQTTVFADNGQIQQVVMNLVINAGEAIGERPGKIIIETYIEKIADVNQWLSLPNDPLSPGYYVVTEVSDDGSGIPEEQIDKIFDPFFSTKFTGRGLGLAAVQGIIYGHFGGIQVNSSLETGSTFRFALPKFDLESPIIEKIPDSQNSDALILVIDDSVFIRDTTAEMLEVAGMRSILAENGEKGIEIYKQKQNEIDLILLDLSMPGIGGAETYKILKSINPDVKVLLSSGYAENDSIDIFRDKDLSGFIQKPYKLDALISSINNILKK